MVHELTGFTWTILLTGFDELSGNSDEAMSTLSFSVVVAVLLGHLGLLILCTDCDSELSKVSNT